MGDILLLYNVVSVFSCKSKSKGPSPSPPPPPVYYYPPPPPKGPDTTTEPLETTTSTETTATTQFFVKTDKYTLLESKYTKKLTNPEFDKFPYIPGSKKPYQDWRKKHKKQKPKIIKGPGSRKPGGGPGGGPGGRGPGGRGPGGRGPGGRGPGGRGPGGRGPGGTGPGGGPWGGGPGGGGPGGGPGWANPWQKGGSKVGAFGSGYDEDEYGDDADADYLNDEDYDYYDGVGYNYDPSYPFKGYGQGEKGFSDPKTFPPWAFSPITNAAVPKFCYEKPDTSICPEKNTVDVKRWCYNPFLDICVPFKFYGCNENENNFHTLQICQSTCIDPGEHPPKSPGCDTETDIIMDELNNYDNSLSTADLSQIPD